MRTNDNSRISSYNTVQLYNFDKRHLHSEDLTIKSDVLSEFGIDLPNVKALKKQLEKN